MLSLLPVTVLATLLYITSSVSAVALRGSIQPNQVLREFSRVGPGAKVTAYPLNVTGPSDTTAYSTFIKSDGSWSIDLPDPAFQPEAAVQVSDATTHESQSAPVQPKSDVYLLKITARALTFRQYRVDVRPAKREGQPSQITVRLHNPIYPISSALYLQNPLPLPLVDSAQTAPTYFQSIQDFNALNYLFMTLKSPMILMAVGAFFLVSVLPKLTAYLDPEEQAQFNQNQKAMNEKMSALQSGDWKNLLTGGFDGPSSSAASTGTAGKKNGVGASGAQAKGFGSNIKKRG